MYVYQSQEIIIHLNMFIVELYVLHCNYSAFLQHFCIIRFLKYQRKKKVISSFSTDS